MLRSRARRGCAPGDVTSVRQEQQTRGPRTACHPSLRPRPPTRRLLIGPEETSGLHGHAIILTVAAMSAKTVVISSTASWSAEA